MRCRAVAEQRDAMPSNTRKDSDFGGTKVAMRSYICSEQEDVQKTVWIIGRIGMKVVIHPEPRRRSGSAVTVLKRSLITRIFPGYFLRPAVQFCNSVNGWGAACSFGRIPRNR
jgi:hypothetical protein